MLLNQYQNSSGLQKLVDALQKVGLGEVIASWIGIDQFTPNGQVVNADSIDPSVILQQFSSLFGQI